MTCAHMKYTDDPGILALYARLEDLGAVARRGEMAMTAFLTPRECLYASSYCEARIREGVAFLWGGFPLKAGDTPPERRRMILLPDYVEGLVSPESLALDPVTALAEGGFYDLSEILAASAVVLSVKGSGFRNLTHRDYLGSVLGLGLERDVTGDIFVADEHSAYLVCKGEISGFLTDNLTYVSTDTVRVTKMPVGFVPPVERKRQAIRDTVASARLDCVVAALTNFSREKAQVAVRSGLVELNYETVEACDTTVEPPCVLSVCGVGKFSVLSFDGETKKGRMRLSAEKYV